VWLDDGEVAVLAAFLEMDEPSFRAVYIRSAAGGIRSAAGGTRGAAGGDRPAARAGTVLREKSNQDCVFFDPARGCTVYDRRPRQCRTYPLWSGIVHSREAWEAESRDCPGIGAGPLHPADEVSATAAADGIPAHRTRLRRPFP
jgi:Fe-S-cluster containining protein